VHFLPGSGAPHPARPAGLPREARFEEGRDQWVVARYSDQGLPQGEWLRWSREGVLRERDEYREGKAHGLWQRFDAGGALVEEGMWRDGTRGGAYRRLGVPAELYADARVFEERGAFDADQTVGPWSLLDATGAVLHARDLGRALDEGALAASPALADAPETTSAQWNELSRALAAEGRPAEALLAAARAAAVARDAAPLTEALARLALPRHAAGAGALAGELVQKADGRLAPLANGLPAGADAASLLRALASSLTGRDRVALDLVDAALLLAPDRAECRVTRALIDVHLGRPDDARADAARLPDELAEQREFLESYARVIFPAPDFGFAPARGEIRTAFPDVPDAPEQPLPQVLAKIEKYATRLGLVREAVRARLPAGAAPAWLPPDPAPLLPDGPVPLERWEFEEIVQDDDAPADVAAEEPQATLVTVDETLSIDSDAPLPSLMRLARREWTGLSWLCWSAGLDRVARPDALAPPADFGQAAGMAIERLWRSRDRLITGGLRAMTQGVPGFVWEGLEIDAMSPVLVEIAADEYLEMRAVFYWLCDQGVQSPWQDNLRAAD
jgi:tetratricopeptide (TPR) repeat protein